MEGTQHIFELYRRYYPKQSELLASLGLDAEGIKAVVLDEGIDALWQRIRNDDNFVKDFKLEALRETLTLAYPSYILALAMGAGKTILIGAIAATEFTMALEYPDGPFVANLRLQAIASLPHLAVFSDEAHHTYGQSLDTELKKVRKTVDYLAQNTNVVCVVNTTGTPYFQRQPLRDVVIWYGLSEGIRENILKDLAGSIESFEFDGNTAAYLDHVIADFFRDYRDVRLPNGAPARLAIYFPQTDDLRGLKPVIDAALVRAGLSPALCLVNTSDDALTRPADIDAFNRLNDPSAPHRVILLVNKGTEGWNCPSLFACALARRLKSSNNFVLQAATRCLRQVPGNTAKARVYLSADNFGILDW